jgi:hypothetical protein
MAKKCRRGCLVNHGGKVRRRASRPQRRDDGGGRGAIAEDFSRFNLKLPDRPRREAPAHPADGGLMTSPEKDEPARVATKRVQIRVTLQLLCHPPVGSILFVGCAVGRVTIEKVVREIWPFYAVMFFVLMLVTYIPSISLWLPRLLSL